MNVASPKQRREAAQGGRVGVDGLGGPHLDGGALAVDAQRAVVDVGAGDGDGDVGTGGGDDNGGGARARAAAVVEEEGAVGEGTREA